MLSLYILAGFIPNLKINDKKNARLSEIISLNSSINPKNISLFLYSILMLPIKLLAILTPV